MNSTRVCLSNGSGGMPRSRDSLEVPRSLSPIIGPWTHAPKSPYNPSVSHCIADRLISSHLDKQQSTEPALSPFGELFDATLPCRVPHLRNFDTCIRRRPSLFQTKPRSPSYRLNRQTRPSHLLVYPTPSCLFCTHPVVAVLNERSIDRPRPRLDLRVSFDAQRQGTLGEGPTRDVFTPAPILLGLSSSHYAASLLSPSPHSRSTTTTRVIEPACQCISPIWPVGPFSCCILLLFSGFSSSITPTMRPKVLEIS